VAIMLPTSLRVRVVCMAIRVLLALSVLAVVYGCGQASSPAERHEQAAGAEKAAA
jgi:hypothetical protein